MATSTTSTNPFHLRHQQAWVQGFVVDLLAALLVACYVLAMWSDWFTHAELSARVKRPWYSEHLDLSEVGPIVWEIPPERLNYAEGIAQIAMSLNLNAAREIPRNRTQVDLRASLRAEGRLPGGEWEDRLVPPTNSKSNQLFGPQSTSRGSSFGMGRLEYSLARVMVNPGEELRVTLDVQVPDGRLMTGLPRLKLIADHGPGDVPYPMIGRMLLREGGFWLSLAAISWLFCRIWLRRRHAPIVSRATVSSDAPDVESIQTKRRR